MKIDGVEYPDHVVEAFCKACELDMPITFLTDEEEPIWFREVMKGFLENFYMGWKAREKQLSANADVPDKVQGVADKLHDDLSYWHKQMLETGAHPRLDELDDMTAMAGTVKRTITGIRVWLDYEKTQ